MNEINGLWLHRFKVNPFKNFDAFHCLDCDGEEACLYCPHCGVTERYEIMSMYKFDASMQLSKLLRQRGKRVVSYIGYCADESKGGLQ